MYGVGVFFLLYWYHEIEDIIAWVIQHREYIAGLSFLLADDHAYELPVYGEITSEEYENAVRMFPSLVDFSYIKEFESSDMTTTSQELACSAGLCELP